MKRGFGIVGLLIAASWTTGTTAMSVASSSGAARCRVIAGEKYLGTSKKTLCREIEAAIAAEVPGARYTAEVKALSPTRLTAQLVVNGRALPEHKFAVMDADLGIESMKRFARSLAADVAKAVKK